LRCQRGRKASPTEDARRKRRRKRRRRRRERGRGRVGGEKEAASGSTIHEGEEIILVVFRRRGGVIL